MRLLYNILIKVAYFIIKITALFNKKIRLFVQGRKEVFAKLSNISPSEKTVWIHSASLGEFEQARPIIEKLKKQKPEYKIIVTFFSPSGYEVRKNYNLADIVCYLPFDTKKNVQKFVKQIQPNLAIIVKYEFWPNLLYELKKTNIKLILISAIFRKNQLFFKPYGSWIRKHLQAFNHFFVQNSQSEKLLKSIGFTDITISGDTRFDRVYKILKQDNSIDFIKEFKSNKHLLVAGSTWEEDESLLVKYINEKASNSEKFIIVPHNINQKKIEKLKNSICKKTILFSDKKSGKSPNSQVLIVDKIGLLTKIYSFADVAYVGGGLKTGLHNVLEPATFGIPVIFGGNKYKKFKEATDLKDLGGCKVIRTQKELTLILKNLLLNLSKRELMGKINSQYIQQNIGATNLIINYINKKI